MNDFIENIHKLHTTEMGKVRIQRNLSIDTDDIVLWCKAKILNESAEIERKGKNWYVTINHYIFTINAHSYTIITAHKTKNEKRDTI
ncbi:MAG: DUF3781 domain-containing protein [Lachnospiraceae bacterium]|nr:DUF3781 domain-containing protein [Lachnospiraceae bacterium]